MLTAMQGTASLDRDRLHASILSAHAADDRGRLATLYTDAARLAAGSTDEACFFLTQAWIMALDAGAETLARELEGQLRTAGRL